MKKLIILSVAGIFFSLPLFSQQDSVRFSPSGRVIARAFIDYSNNFDNESGFDVKRALLGYDYQITPSLRAQLVIDAAAGTRDNRYETYIRNAFLNWSDKGLDINAGLIGLLQFSLQESYWQHRYVERTVQDINKMGASVDLGTTVSYTFNKYVSADLSLTNGEGHRNLSKDNSYRTAVGVNLHPVENAVFRIYGDCYNETGKMRPEAPEGLENVEYKNQYVLSLFAGYRIKALSAGAEFNKLFNKGFIGQFDYYAWSVYSSVQISPKWNIYARYDEMDSSSPAGLAEPWNNDNRFVIAGIEYRPLKQLKISPNFRNTNPSKGRSEQALFVSLEFNL